MSDFSMIRPYTMEEPPASDGRVFLAFAFSFYCIAEWGFAPSDIEDAFAQADHGGAGRHDRELIFLASREIGKTFLRGQVQTYARPFGGGPPIRLTKSMWELDDFSGRFATSAINPNEPFDPAASCTHWLFVDGGEFDEILGRCHSQAQLNTPRTVSPPTVPEPVVIGQGRFLRMPEVLGLVGMSRSTMYDRMKAGRFPRNLDLGGNLVVWRETDVRSWMASQGGIS